MSRQGSIKKDSGGWYFVLDVTPPGAPRKQIKRRGFRTKDEARDALDAIKHATRTGANVEPTKQTVGGYLEEWLATIEPTVRPSTHHSYSRNLRLHVVPNVGDVPCRRSTVAP